MPSVESKIDMMKDGQPFAGTQDNQSWHHKIGMDQFRIERLSADVGNHESRINLVA